LRFEWDEDKARRNLAKHGIAFDLAKRVWDDPMHVIIPDRIDENEMRWHALGVVGAETLLVVVHVYRGHDDVNIRIIGARKATRQERRHYEEEGT
jgi:uncharacterized DUF497 family protein